MGILIYITSVDMTYFNTNNDDNTRNRGSIQLFRFICEYIHFPTPLIYRCSFYHVENIHIY